MVYFLFSISNCYIFLYEKNWCICYWSCYNSKIFIYQSIFLRWKIKIQNAFGGFSWPMEKMFLGPDGNCALCHWVISVEHHRYGIFATLSDIDINKLCYKFHWNNWRNTLEVLRWFRSLEVDLMELVLIVAQFGSSLKSLRS